MNYKKDLNIFGYVDAFGDIAKVSKTTSANQKIKNLLNMSNSDSRLSTKKINNSIEFLKEETNLMKKATILDSLKYRIYNRIPDVKNLKITTKKLDNEMTFSVVYSINDEITKNIINSSFKFTLDT
jgi:ABC-type uncharacterized transport system ATPase subunit